MSNTRIITNKSLTEIKSNYITRFKKISSSETLLPQGDGIIKISPFDDYFLFTLFDENDGEDIPIDLSNVGTIYISFIDDSNEIRIPNHTNVEDINMSTGEVLFKISKEKGKQILSLKNRNFYISTSMLTQDTENNTSDESVLYTGKFLSITEAAEKSLTKKIQDLTDEYSTELSTLNKKIQDLNNEILKKDQIINDNNIIIQSLESSNKELVNEISNLTNNSKTEKIKEIEENAKKAQKKLQESKKKNSQNIGLSNTNVNYKTLVKVQEKYTI